MDILHVDTAEALNRLALRSFSPKDPPQNPGTKMLTHGLGNGSVLRHCVGLRWVEK